MLECWKRSKTKKHKRHAEIREWLGEDVDSRAFDPDLLKADVAALAKQLVPAVLAYRVGARNGPEGNAPPMQNDFQNQA